MCKCNLIVVYVCRKTCIGFATMVSGTSCGWVVKCIPLDSRRQLPAESCLRFCCSWRLPTTALTTSPAVGTEGQWVWLWRWQTVQGIFWEQFVAIQEVWPQDQEQISDLFKGFSLFFHLCQERKSSQLEDSDASAASTILYTHWDSRDKGHPSFFSYENIG